MFKDYLATQDALNDLFGAVTTVRKLTGEQLLTARQYIRLIAAENTKDSEEHKILRSLETLLSHMKIGKTLSLKKIADSSTNPSDTVKKLDYAELPDDVRESIVEQLKPGTKGGWTWQVNRSAHYKDFNNIRYWAEGLYYATDVTTYYKETLSSKV